MLEAIFKISRPAVFLLIFCAGACQNPHQASTPSIVGGKALSTKHPIARSTLAITYHDKLLCSAVLIGKDLAATAAHCFEDLPDPRDLRVHYGEELPDDFSIGAPVEQYQIHEDYSFPKYDIAWLQVKNPPPRLAKVAAVDTCTDHLQPKQVIYLSGYGATKGDGSGLGTKLSTRTKIRSYHESNDHPGLIFYGGKKGRSACYGDSGGPAFIRLSSKRWAAIGIANGPDFIIAKTDNCEAGNGIYTSFAKHWPWFEKALATLGSEKNKR